MTQLKLAKPNLKTLDSFFEDFFQDSNLPLFPKNNGLNFPAVNIVENEKNYELELNVPGRKKEDFKIKLEKDMLTVSFESEKQKTEETKKFIKREFVTQSFSRSFTLDDKINTEAIEAKYEDGILKLMLPKKEELIVQPKEISIQ